MDAVKATATIFPSSKTWLTYSCTRFLKFMLICRLRSNDPPASCALTGTDSTTTDGVPTFGPACSVAPPTQEGPAVVNDRATSTKWPTWNRVVAKNAADR